MKHRARFPLLGGNKCFLLVAAALGGCAVGPQQEDSFKGIPAPRSQSKIPGPRRQRPMAAT